MGEILTPIAFQIELLRLTEGTLAANKRRGHPADIAKGRKAAERAEKALDAHNAALRAEVERLKKALGYITDISEANAYRAIVEMKRIAHEALDSAPADEEGRDE